LDAWCAQRASPDRATAARGFSSHRRRSRTWDDCCNANCTASSSGKALSHGQPATLAKASVEPVGGRGSSSHLARPVMRPR
jgi:hypothetical protein